MITSNFNTRYTCNHAWQHLLLPCMTALCLMASCSSDKVIEEIEEIKPSNDPMRFNGISAVEESSATRAGNVVYANDFLVSSYKAFGTGSQQTVMDRYEVKKKTSGSDWYGSTTSWGYVGTMSNGFYKDQIERYWDYNAYPYRFHAIAQACSNSYIFDASSAGSITLSDTQLTLPESIVYTYETYSAGAKQSGTEPLVVSQVMRDTDGRDYDLLMEGETAGTFKEINKESANTLNRSVSLPFHHLTSKVCFGIYCQDLGTPSENFEIEDVVIKVTSSSFKTKGKGYSATLSSTQKMLDGNFSSFDTASSVELLNTTDATYASEENYLCKARNQKTAYMCKVGRDGLLQIPQTGVKMTASIKIKGKMFDDTSIGDFGDNGKVWYNTETGYTIFENIPIVLKDEENTIVSEFDWEINTRYTYYLILSRFFGEPITFTCSLAPWEDISGSLSTDLEQ